MEIFNSLHKPVDEVMLVIELFNTGKFTKEDVRSYIKTALTNGQIYQVREGYYAKV